MDAAEGEVRTALACYPVDGLLEGRLRQRLGHRSGADVRRALERLVDAGDVKFEKGRWKLTRSGIGRVKESEAKAELFPDRAEDCPLCIPVKISKESAIPLEKKDGGGDAIGGTEAAAPFHRRILNYFADIVELEGSPQGTLHWEDREKLWIPIYFRERWWTRDEGETCLWELPSTGQIGDFYVTLTSSRERRRCLRVGYPIHVKRERRGDEEDIALRPLFFSPVELLPKRWAKDGARVLLRMVHNLPAVNRDWLGELPMKNDGEVLLESLGYDADGEINEEGRAAINYESLVKNLGTTPATRQLREILDPLQMGIRLSLPPAGGIVNAAMLFIAEPGSMCKKTIFNLRHIAGRKVAGTSLAQLLIPKSDLKNPPAAEPYAVPLLLPSGRDFNSDQFYAAISAQNVPLVTVQGPPGTGKSFLVAGLMLSLLLNGRSVLLASRNHKAIDAVQEKFRELERKFLGEGKQNFPLPPTLLRRMTYKGKGYKKDSFQSVARELLENAEARKRPCDGGDVEVALGWKALEPKIKRQRELLAKIEELYGSREHIVDREERLWRSDGELPSLSFWKKCLRKFANFWRSRHLQVLHRLPDSIEKIGELLADFLALQRDMGEAVAKLLPLHLRTLWAVDRERAELIKRHCAIEPSEEELAKAVLRHAPAWAITSQSVGQLPEVAGLFDYLIVDEAGQSDIGSALPLLWRAKHACIVGDPRQLAPIRHLGQKTEERLLREHHIPKREAEFLLHLQNSLFECADHYAHVKQRLCQHYRCAAAIARYFNRFFYGNALQLMTDEEKLRLPERFRPGLSWEDVRGPLERPRDAPGGWHCEAEAEALVHWVHERLLQGFEGSLGVVTFFTCQRTLIQKKLDTRLSHARPRGDWSPPTVATAHGFQGGECDVICLSLCLGEDEREGSHSFLKKNLNLLNVAVSRARALCVVFANGAAAEKSTIGEVQGLWKLSQGRRARGDGGEGEPFESPWEEKFFHALRRRGVETIPQYVTCGRRLDLAYLEDGLRLDIEVDGVRYHAIAEGIHCPEDLWRDHILKTDGWKVLRFWVSELRRDMDGCVDRVWGTIEAWKRKRKA
ncbi:MAG: DUF559 domain-containing protein [Puniceicoccales bacterium]|jgi:very-short-patch-repair endonuclease|nr:DUF559 domain-containing protein [Puniceicoccales bacterium]